MASRRVLLGPWALDHVGLGPDWLNTIDNAEVVAFGKNCPIVHQPYVDTFDDILKQLPSDFDPDIFVAWQPQFYPPPFGFEKQRCLSVAALIDWQHLGLFGSGPEILRPFDLVFADATGCVYLRKHGFTNVFQFLGSSFDTNLDRSRNNVTRDIDISFAGAIGVTFHRKRDRILARVADLSDRYHIQISPWLLDRQTYSAQLQRSKIVINHSYRSELNLRFFEAMACGALVFLEKGNADAIGHFDEGVHYVAYDDDNLEELLAYYLQHDEKRETIAQAGFQKVQKHSNAHHISWLIERSASFLNTQTTRIVSPQTAALQGAIDLNAKMNPPRFKMIEHELNRLGKEPQPPLAWAFALHGSVSHRLALHDDENLKLAFFRQAYSDLGQAIELGPEQAWPHYLMGELMRSLKNADEASKSFERCLEKCASLGERALDLVTPPAYFDLSWWTIYWLERGIRSDLCGQVKLLEARCCQQLAQVCLEASDFQTALHHLTRATDFDPSVLELHGERAEVAFDFGLYKECVHSGFQACEGLPLSPLVWLTTAQAFINLNEFEKGRYYLEKLKKRLTVIQGYDVWSTQADKLLETLNQYPGGK